MTRDEARLLTDYLFQAQSELSDALKCAESLSEKHESESLRRTLMAAIADLAAYAIAPILELHPDLQPPYSEDE